MTDTTPTPSQRRIWRTPQGKEVFAHAVWVGSWFAGTHQTTKHARRIIQHPAIKQCGASREQMEKIIAAYAKEHSWTEVGA